MSFASSGFLLFLALVLGIFPFVPQRGRVAAMLLASYLFYFGQQPVHLILLVASTLLDFGVGLMLGGGKSERVRRRWLFVSLIGNVGALIAFKYSALLARAWNLGAGDSVAMLPVPDWVLPLGISFYTFQTIGYTLDVYRRRIEPSRNLLEYALYVSFFPQLIAGPIERAQKLLPQLQRLQPVGLGNLSLGMRLFLWGLLKKVCIADRFRPMAIEMLVHPEGHDTLTLALGGASLLAILYLDFSAYTDMARGVARLFGVELVQNFRTPFGATSIGEFTRRWHVSLIHWIEDYLYAPLMRGRITHWKIWRANVLLIGLFGLWHGAYGSFLLGGLMLGVFISIQQSLRLARAQQGRRGRIQGRLRLFLGWAGTMAIWSMFVVVLFAADGSVAIAYYRELLCMRFPGPGDWGSISASLGLLGVGLAVHLGSAKVDLQAAWLRIPSLLRPLLLVALALSIGAFAAPDSSDFVYFRF